MTDRRRRRRRSGCPSSRLVQAAERERRGLSCDWLVGVGSGEKEGLTRIFRGRPLGLFPFFWNRSSRSCSLEKTHSQ